VRREEGGKRRKAKGKRLVKKLGMISKNAQGKTLALLQEMFAP